MTYQDFIEYIQTNLLANPHAIQRDCAVFNYYMKDEMTLEETMEQFKIHNDLDRDFPAYYFKCWLERLGYIK